MRFWDSAWCLRRSRLEERGKADRAARGVKPGSGSLLTHGSCARVGTTSLRAARRQRRAPSS